MSSFMRVLCSHASRWGNGVLPERSGWSAAFRSRSASETIPAGLPRLSSTGTALTALSARIWSEQGLSRHEPLGPPAGPKGPSGLRQGTYGP